MRCLLGVFLFFFYSGLKDTPFGPPPCYFPSDERRRVPEGRPRAASFDKLRTADRAGRDRFDCRFCFHLFISERRPPGLTQPFFFVGENRAYIGGGGAPLAKSKTIKEARTQRETYLHARTTEENFSLTRFFVLFGWCFFGQFLFFLCLLVVFFFFFFFCFFFFFFFFSSSFFFLFFFFFFFFFCFYSLFFSFFFFFFFSSLFFFFFFRGRWLEEVRSSLARVVLLVFE